MPEIIECFPENNQFDTYVEPFVGGGSTLFYVLENYNIKRAYISDTNKALISTYQAVKNDVNKLILKLSKLEEEYLSLDYENRKKYYKAIRNKYNSYIQNNDYNDIASLFIFLNKTCFNGLYRVNKKGLFNVPMGKYKNPTICDKENLTNVSKALKDVEIHCASYEKCESFITDKTLVYFDPPYRPLNITSSFTSYTKDGFCDDKQIELAKFIKGLSDKNVFVILSNSDPKNVDKNDNFFDELYAFLTIKRVPAPRCINSNTSKRGKITEILAYNTDLEVV